MVTILSFKTGLKISLISLIIIFILSIAGASTAYAGFVLSPTPNPDNTEVVLNGHVYYSDGVTPWPGVGVYIEYYPYKSSPVTILTHADSRGYYSYTTSKDQLLPSGSFSPVTRWADLPEGIVSEHDDDHVDYTGQKMIYSTRDFVTPVNPPVTPTPAPSTTLAPTATPIITTTPTSTPVPTPTSAALPSTTATTPTVAVNSVQASPSTVPSTAGTVTPSAGPSAESPSAGIPTTYAIFGAVVIVVLLIVIAYLLGSRKK